jgi:hypothetical protein
MGEPRISEDDRELLKQEYDNVFAQIEHWDNQFWTKSRFFLLLESAFLGVAFQFAGTNLINDVTLSVDIVALGLVVCLFNIYLAYVWFRSVRRVREYLEPRVERARQIELLVESEVAWNSFIQQDEHVSSKGSSRWEIHLPTSFIVMWFVAGGVLAFEFTSWAAAMWVMLLLALALYLEWGMWFGTKDVRDYDPDIEEEKRELGLE